ncbi:TPA: hypothetical protein ACIGVG_004147 [Salmonella enterica]|uniref:hypothetical protein n=1 Tax=Salmonella enterica TaxID=28901 RepID=UPI0012DBB4A6|nr:hypothetical protein [Salmonella enterica subsp. enterica serovar Reading]EBW4794892.1 hypothetical protein [Salmonella enterica subsp. enterica serovar Reading]EDP1392888.1 hypothetical protein [Salmonella enterica subsp. enterica serovar Reading]EDX9403908.1 hypothetical protein [Salmonella enterica subsp. enterica serovar Nottingham]
MSNSGNVIIYSRLWPETMAIEGICALVSYTFRITTCFSPEDLVKSLSAHPGAHVILGILPHESLRLLSMLKPYLQTQHLLFWGHRFNYVDRTLPFYFLSGDIHFHERENDTVLKSQAVLSSFITSNPSVGVFDGCSAVKPEPRSTVKPEPRTVEALMSDVNDYLLRMFYHYGVDYSTGRVLQMLSCGYSTKDVASSLGMSDKIVSLHKIKGLRLLHMKVSNNNIYRGIFVKKVLQQEYLGVK